MSIFKKVLGIASAGVARVRVARGPRVAVRPLHRVSFRTEGRDVRVANVSGEGAGLMRDDLPGAKAGDAIRGELTVGASSFPVVASVRHVSGQVIGCLIEGGGDSLSRAIDEYFRVEMLGLKLRKMNRAYMKADPLGEPTWFSDGGLNELYFVEKDGRVVRFHMTLFGHYVEGGEGRAVRTGQVTEERGGRSGFREGSPLVEISSESSRQVLELGRQLLRNVEELDEALRLRLEAQLDASRLAPLNPGK